MSKKKKLVRVKGWLARKRGQAMVSYAIITGLLLGVGFVMSIKILPAMLEAYNQFAQSLYFSVNMPLP